MSLLTVTGVGKSYRKYKTEFHRFASWFGFPCKPCKETWVLKNINFSLERGQSLGIIGQNGDGKSTLLKIITGTLYSTVGYVSINGSVSSILELGMGFSQELTARENVRHTLAMLGFSVKEIDNTIDEIRNFAEIGEYFDKPFKTYSSGMQMRVAFAVVTAKRPDLLIIDEALSVGDASFQNKCFLRIKEFKRLGTSLLIVSHDKNTILTFCDYAILLHKGEQLKYGLVNFVFSFYRALFVHGTKRREVTVVGKEGESCYTISGSFKAKVTDIGLYNEDGDSVESVYFGEKVSIHVSVVVYEKIKKLVFGYSIKDRMGFGVFGINTFITDQVIIDPSLNREYKFIITFDVSLSAGDYIMELSLQDYAYGSCYENYYWNDQGFKFTVVDPRPLKFVGFCNIDTVIEVI